VEKHLQTRRKHDPLRGGLEISTIGMLNRSIIISNVVAGLDVHDTFDVSMEGSAATRVGMLLPVSSASALCELTSSQLLMGESLNG